MAGVDAGSIYGHAAPHSLIPRGGSALSTTPAEPSSQAARLRGHPVRFGALRSPRRRRPTGEPPPLPYQLQTSGIGWLVATVVLVGLSMAVFAGGLRGPAVTVTVVDDAVVGWLSGLRRPGLTGGLQALAALSSWWTLQALGVGLVLALLALRRIRHLIIVVILAEALSVLVLRVLGATATRPRPFGVAIATSWGGWALPSLQVTLFAAGLVAILYTLVPEGRWRNTGKWVATALVALTALGRMALGADAPTDVLVAVAVGATVPLLAFRRYTPNAAFPISYRGGRSAHLDIGGARGEAIRRAFCEQLGLIVRNVEPFGRRHSASCTPLRITVEGDPRVRLFGKLCAQSHLRADRWYKLREDRAPHRTIRGPVVRPVPRRMYDLRAGVGDRPRRTVRGRDDPHVRVHLPCRPPPGAGGPLRWPAPARSRPGREPLTGPSMSRDPLRNQGPTW
jgi:membrane-associated phospholipid phosphatase